MNLDPVSTIVRADSIISTDVDGETVLFSVADGHYYGLDPIGSAIWAEVAVRVRVDAVCQRMAEQYDGAADEIAADTLEFLGEFADLALVDVVPNGG
jgi:Coenzyme PQQ synthesis protein D (PqqD)